MNFSWLFFRTWITHIIPVVVVAVIFWMLQEPLLLLLNFLQDSCLAPLSRSGVAAFVFIVTIALFKWELVNWKIYVPRPIFLWLFLLLGVYFYYRHWEGSFLFWMAPILKVFILSDLLLIPWGGVVAMSFRSGTREDRYFFGFVIAVLCVLFFVNLRSLPEEQWRPLVVESVISILPALYGVLCVYLWLWMSQHWESYRSRSQKEPRGVMHVPAQADVSSQPIDTDEAMLSREEDWLGVSGIAKVLQENLTELDLSKSSLTVGIIAPWGKGKSSFMNLLKERLEKEKAIIISFNPRASKSVSSIQEDFLMLLQKSYPVTTSALLSY